ncbi:MAG: polysaccharide deacetylase family protein, partial [Elusimicrobiota bacterium]
LKAAAPFASGNRPRSEDGGPLAAAGEKSLPENPVLITFDDGYANNYETAFPVLQELKVKANVFLVFETLGRHNAWHAPSTEPWQRMLDLAQVERMQDSGLVEFGSHTMTHKDLAAIPLEEVRWELRESKKRLEEALGRPVTAFAYPYGAGAFKPEVRAAVLEAGYLHDFSVRQGIAPRPWEPGLGPIARLLIRGDDNRFDFHLNLTRGKSRF